MTKFELAISTGYVPDWTIVEAFRELFQNALDNEIVNPENKMSWNYSNNEVSIKNKTSKLPVESLLLGSSTKSDDKNTIGKHGEGYKIAFMVLLRNSKTIKVYNYGAKEVWDVRLVKSRRYNNQLVPTVFVEKNHIWDKVPNSDLEIVVSGITEEVYESIVNKNLHLRKTPVKKFVTKDRGDIILDPEESGNVYVKGLFVTKIEGLYFGYDFEPSVLGLDRDRKLVDSFNVSWEASILWQNAADKDEGLANTAVNLVNEKALDVRYVDKISYNPLKLRNAVARNFFETHGENAVPVVNTSEYEEVKECNLGKPVITTESIASLIKGSSVVNEKPTVKMKSVKEKLEDFIAKIEDRLTDDELTEISELIKKVNN